MGINQIKSVPITICIALVAAALPPLSSHAVEIAARPEVPVNEQPVIDDHQEYRKAGKSILDIQKALSEMGFYLGAQDGHLNADTRAAIRVFQQGAGLKVTGKVTRQLWDLLTNAVEVRRLLKRLDRVRKSSKDKARNALLAHPATKDLITDVSEERANPTRDTSACYAAPTVRCLLEAASQNVKAVFKPELRDWALGEILVAQSRAGLTEEAMATAARMKDPRLIMVALRDIAKGQALAGNGVEARDAAGIIPDALKKSQALAEIAEIQARQRDLKEAKITVDVLTKSLIKLDTDLQRLSFETRIAVIFAKLGEKTRASEQLAEIEARAREHTAANQQSVALKHVAAALAEIEFPDQALSVLDNIDLESERRSVLISTATAQAKAGDTAAALITADSIEAVRYRAVLLGKIALSQAQRNQLADADTTLQTALAAIDKIKLPYARSFAASQIALVISKVAAFDPQKEFMNEESNETSEVSTSWPRFKKAVDVAGGIDDNRLRAHTLWTISIDQRRAGDEEGSEATANTAALASNDIKSYLTQVWMYAEIAENLARSGEAGPGWSAFEKGIEIAAKIDNSWGRARALAKLAQTLVGLVVPDPLDP
jgi:peptidoglycan hydrolase-like protein with peptidoglycan-binding domain